MLSKVAAEFVGTAFLLATVIGSGIMASQLSDDPGLQLLENSIATGAVLVALILTLQPVSAAFNPVVTAVEVALGQLKLKDAAPLVAAQFAGGFVGAVAANLMFELDAIQVASHVRDGPGMWLAEVIATFGLVIIIFGGMRAGRTDTIAFAVGGYIAAAYWFTSSTSFANPSRHRCPHLLRHLRRHCARVSPDVRGHAGHRRRTRMAVRPACPTRTDNLSSRSEMT